VSREKERDAIIESVNNVIDVNQERHLVVAAFSNAKPINIGLVDIELLLDVPVLEVGVIGTS